MNLSISIESSTAGKLLALLQHTPREAAAAMLRGVEKGSLELLGLAQKENFTGKGPFAVSSGRLGVVSGRLRRSMRFTKPQVDGDGKVSVRAGSNVKYWAVHEFGFQGKVSVRAAKVKNTNNLFGQGRISLLAHTRRAHSRNVNVPERKPLRTAIEKHSTRVYVERIKEEINQLI